MTIKDSIRRIFPEESNIPQEWQLSAPIEHNTFLLDGNLVPWNGPAQEVISPIWTPSPSGPMPRMIGRHPRLAVGQAMAALDSAVKAYGHGKGLWPCMSVTDRIAHVRKFAAMLERQKKEIITLLMWEIGKPLLESASEFDRTMEYITDTIAALEDKGTFASRSFSQGPIHFHLDHAPLGVALCLGAYNFPLNETLTLVIPALLMGNTVVFKPPRFGALVYGALLGAFRDSFPPGTVNVIWGDDDLAASLMASGKVDIFGFVGTGQAADSLCGHHPRPRRLKCIMGLEAKNPAIILPDADSDLAVQECIEGALKFNGQRCTALKILLVHQGLATKFVQKLSDAMRNLPFGMPWEKDAFLTPLPDRDRLTYLTNLLDDAVSSGARIINEGGGTVHGSFFYPALVYPVTQHMRLFREEQFGPIVPVVPFDTETEPVDFVLESPYSQQASIFGSRNSLIKVVEGLKNQVCRININSHCRRGPDHLPFAARKDSGLGIRSVEDTLKAFSVPVFVATHESDVF